MRILSIETSCDETAIALLKAVGDFPNATYTVLAHALFSQIDIHKEYGGVFPAVAKREHARTLVPMLQKIVTDSDLSTTARKLTDDEKAGLNKILEREFDLAQALTIFIESVGIPEVDLISVTQGPGLEPALWVGINFAKALSIITDVPVIPINHMEGHIISSVFDGAKLADVQFPAISLLISGGHTELILMESWEKRVKIGATRDDAIGEAFDKTARMLGFSYPGGPEISLRAARARDEQIPIPFALPRPMLNTDDFDFSFSGIKTAVRYGIEKITLDDDTRAGVAREFEDAVTTVLIKKTLTAIEKYNACSLIIGGGVIANKYIRSEFERAIHETDATLYVPHTALATDNAIMIALAAHEAHTQSAIHSGEIVANGNWSVEK